MSCSAAQRFALPALGRGRRSRPARKMIRRRKLPEICAESPASGARFVGRVIVEEVIPEDRVAIFILNNRHNSLVLLLLPVLQDGKSDNQNISILEIPNCVAHQEKRQRRIFFPQFLQQRLHYNHQLV